MKYKKNLSFVIFKIDTPFNINFLKEHQEIINTYGYTWLSKFGKSILKINNLLKTEHVIFIKDSKKNGNKIYIATYTEINNFRKSPYPEYYNNIKLISNIHFKITKIKEISLDFMLKNFIGKTTSTNLNIFFKSITKAIYITNINEIEIS